MALVYNEMVESNQMAFDPGQTLLVEHLGNLQSAIEDYEPFWKSIYMSQNKKTDQIIHVKKAKSFKNKKDHFQTFFVQNRKINQTFEAASYQGDFK